MISHNSFTKVQARTMGCLNTYKDDWHAKLPVKKKKKLYGFLALSRDKLNTHNVPHSVVPSAFCFLRISFIYGSCCKRLQKCFS